MALPTIRQLSFLTALAETGSFSGAAKVCHVTQPTLSAGIKELERLLGVTVAEREARGARLTRAGQIAAERARAIIADAHDLVETMHSEGQPFNGPFTLGAIPTIAPFLFAEMARALNTAHPDLKLYLTEDKTDHLLNQLKSRRIDAAIIALPWDTRGIETMDLFDDEFLVAVSSKHPLAAQACICPNDLNSADILLLEDGHCLRDHALSICQFQTGESARQVAATSLGTLVSMIAGGLGVSLLPRLAIDNGLPISDELVIRPFEKPIIGRRIGIAWRTGSSHEAEARQIGELIRATSKQPLSP